MAKDSDFPPPPAELDAPSDDAERATLLSIREMKARNDALISRLTEQVNDHKAKRAISAAASEKLLNMVSSFYVGLAINSITAGTFVNFALDGGRSHGYLVLGLAYGVFFLVLAALVSYGSSDLQEVD